MTKNPILKMKVKKEIPGWGRPGGFKETKNLMVVEGEEREILQKGEAPRRMGTW